MRHGTNEATELDKHSNKHRGKEQPDEILRSSEALRDQRLGLPPGHHRRDAGVNIYKVRDSVAETWFPAFEAENNATAERLFRAACNDHNSPLGKNPSDYELWIIGHFNDTNGKLTQGDDHRQVVKSGAAFKTNGVRFDGPTVEQIRANINDTTPAVAGKDCNR